MDFEAASTDDGAHGFPFTEGVRSKAVFDKPTVVPGQEAIHPRFFDEQ